MSEPFGTPLLVANPAAGDGRRRTLERLEVALRDAGLAYDVIHTRRRGDALEVTRDAVGSGHRFVVAVGGDGTLHEVVNGMFDPVSGCPLADGTVLGVVSAGSGCDFARTFGLDRAPEQLAAHLAGTSTMTVDLGRVRVRGTDGSERVELFANVAQVGFGARVAGIAARLPRRMGRRRYAAAVVLGWPRFGRSVTRVRVDGGETAERVCNVVVANGQFMGGGMHVAPRALPSDGKLSVQSWGGRPSDVVRAVAQLRRGVHLARSDVRSWSSSVAEVSAPRRLPVEADGERIGSTPAVFDVLPGALTLKV